MLDAWTYFMIFLFDLLKLIGVDVTSSLVSKEASKEPVNKLQKAFVRLQKQIEELEEDFDYEEKVLDQYLKFYYLEISPKKNQLLPILQEFIKIVYEYYKKPKLLSKREKKALKELLLVRLERVLCLTPVNEADFEMKAIFKELNGVGYDEIVSGNLDDIKEELKAMMGGDGDDIDFSDLDSSGSEAEILGKLFGALNSAKLKMEEKEGGRKKSKKEIERELRELEVEKLQKKGVSTIYKQLAKVFHPDLEQDPIMKIKKEELMKKLTRANDDNDLHALLSLQRSYMSEENGFSIKQTDDQLKIYNSILKEQVDELKKDTEFLRHHPKYFPIQYHLNSDLEYSLMSLRGEAGAVSLEIDDFKKLLSQLKGPMPLDVIRLMISYVELE